MSEQNQINAFFRAIDRFSDAYEHASFSYVSVKHADEYVLISGRIFLSSVRTTFPLTHLQSPDIRAGHYTLEELGMDARTVIDNLLKGQLQTPGGPISFPKDTSGRFSVSFVPFHDEGLKIQKRIPSLYIAGDHKASYVRQPSVDWSLKAGKVPYDGLQELMFTYGLGYEESSTANVEVIAFPVLGIDEKSTVDGLEAKVLLNLANKGCLEKVTLGYRVFSENRVWSRSAISGKDMQWEEAREFQRGTALSKVPVAAVLQCFASYNAVAQNQYWIADPSKVQNPRRSAYEVFDPKLETLDDFIAKSQDKRRDTDDFETGIAWLLWMLGFSVAHLGGTARTRDAADLIATTPEGHFAVVECTTGLLKAESKLPLLFSRAVRVRERLEATNNRHLSVLPVIVTSKSREEVRADLAQAEKLGILVLTNEDLERMRYEATHSWPNADKLYKEIESVVRTAQAKHEGEESQQKLL